MVIIDNKRIHNYYSFYIFYKKRDIDKSNVRFCLPSISFVVLALFGAINAIPKCTYLEEKWSGPGKGDDNIKMR